MSIELLVSIASNIGLVIGAFVNHFLAKNKYSAEIEKIQAEADKARAETEKIQKEILESKSSLLGTTSLNQEQLDEVISRVSAKVQTIQIKAQYKPPNALYQPPKLSDRLIYIYEVTHDIRNKIHKLVLSWGGGWAGCSMADLDSYLEKATSFNLIPESIANEINDFHSYTLSIINGDDVSDTQFLRIQYLAANINEQLTYTLEKHIADGYPPLAYG
jgi:hypothetical protein